MRHFGCGTRLLRLRVPCPGGIRRLRVVAVSPDGMNPGHRLRRPDHSRLRPAQAGGFLPRSLASIIGSGLWLIRLMVRPWSRAAVPGRPRANRRGQALGPFDWHAQSDAGQLGPHLLSDVLARRQGPGDGRHRQRGPVLDPTSGKSVATLAGHVGAIRSLAFTRDGKTLASASFDGLVKLWDVATKTERSLMPAHSGGCLSVAFSPDGKTLVTTGNSRRARASER